MDLQGELERFEAELLKAPAKPAGRPPPPGKPPGAPPPPSAISKPAGLPPPPAVVAVPAQVAKPAGPPPVLRPAGPPPQLAAPSASHPQQQPFPQPTAGPSAAQPYAYDSSAAYAQAGYSAHAGYDAHAAYSAQAYASQAAYGAQAGYADPSGYYSAQPTYYAEAQPQQPQPQQAAPASVVSQQAMTMYDIDALRESILAEPKDSKNKKKKKEKVEGATMRIAGGEIWYDDTLDQWPKNDFRIFVGNLGPEVSEDTLAKAFHQFPSYAKCKIVMDNKLQKSKGYGFVSLTDAVEGAKAIRQMNNTYIGNRPCKLKKSSLEARTAPESYKKRKAMIVNPLERITAKRSR